MFFFRFFWKIIGGIFGSNFFRLFNPLVFYVSNMIGPNKKKLYYLIFLLLEEKFLPEYKYLFKNKGFLQFNLFLMEINHLKK